MVFQTPAESFDPRRTLGESAAESLRNQGLGKAEAASRVQELFLRCGLQEEYLTRYPHEVSGGQCQRAAIAHDIALVQQFCDRVLVMDQGRMIEEGTPDEVIRAPRQEYTKRLIESIL